MMDDTELLRAYAENHSETAFAEFVRRRVGFVYAAALRMVSGDAHTAQDIAQSVFVLAANKAPALATHKHLAGWLHMATRNISRETLRAARRRATREQEAARMTEIENETTAATAASPAAAARQADILDTRVQAPEKLRPLLDDALCALRESEREAVLLRYFEGKGFAEIGVKLSLSEETARKRVTRAVEKMRAAFAKRGVTSSATALAALMTAEAAQAAPAGLAASVSAGAITSAAATAAAAGGASATGTILAFMSSAKITTIAVVALLLAAGGAFYGSQSGRALSSALARARQENAKLETQLRESEKQNTKASAAATKRDQKAVGDAFLADYPEVKEKGIAWGKSLGAKEFFRIAHEMNLSPEQIARLAEIMHQTPFVWDDDIPGYGTASYTIGGDPQLGPKKQEQELRDLLGDDGYEKYNELKALDNADKNFNIRRLSNALYFTDAPLTSQQAWSLDEIVSDLSKNHADITDPQARWDALMERAKSVLSPEQMRALAEAGDRYIWERTSDKWRKDYDDPRTVISSKPWTELLKESSK